MSELYYLLYYQIKTHSSGTIHEYVRYFIYIQFICMLIIVFEIYEIYIRTNYLTKGEINGQMWKWHQGYISLIFFTVCCITKTLPENILRLKIFIRINALYCGKNYKFNLNFQLMETAPFTIFFQISTLSFKITLAFVLYFVVVILRFSAGTFGQMFF